MRKEAKLSDSAAEEMEAIVALDTM